MYMCYTRKQQAGLLTAKKKGAEALTTFVEDRLLSTSKCFCDTLSKLELGNFSNVKKSPLLSKEGKTVIFRAAQTSAVITNAMAILQVLSKIPDRFSDLAEMVFNRILLQAGEATRVDFVGDQYPEISIKNIEREKR